ncbi:MAG: Asp-tRNA(Asn)/Glu-tRNA(Gln) amidotransferase subunit GatC [Planctomycetota bacterium]|nr:Asp-tRNA(Asn)/Glu-tRNA(Gln) amidotransferase subunit GatC [Planctomycetota bacterium]
MLTTADIQRLAKLARLEVSPGRISEVQADLSRILELFEQLTQVDTSNVEPLVHAIEISDVLAPDHVVESLRVQDVLSNAPSHDESFFKVPPVLG